VGRSNPLFGADAGFSVNGLPTAHRGLCKCCAKGDLFFAFCFAKCKKYSIGFGALRGTPRRGRRSVGRPDDLLPGNFIASPFSGL
jgi:hypothetical protein